MRKALLLYNPLSGRHPSRRLADVQAVADVLMNAGIEASLAATRGKDTVTEQVRQAIASGCDTVFACGGDGTIHDVIQGLVGTNIALGIIPMGTANVLAHDLKIPRSPLRAAESALQSQLNRVSVGFIEYKDLAGKPTARYFTAAAGIGVDAHLFYRLDAGVKGRLGMGAYYAMAWRLWMTLKMEYFAATCDHRPEEYLLTQLLAVRIQNFGGVLRELAPGASLSRNDLQLVLCKTNSRLSYLAYVLRGILNLRWRVPGIELMASAEVKCDYPALSDSSKKKVYVEADGELLGSLPVRITILRDALTILAPTASRKI